MMGSTEPSTDALSPSPVDAPSNASTPGCSPEASSSGATGVCGFSGVSLMIRVLLAVGRLPVGVAWTRRSRGDVAAIPQKRQRVWL